MLESQFNLKPRREFNPSPIPLPRTLPPTIDWQHGSIDLEIGCGSGLHPIRYGQANPERTLIAIEHTAEKFAKFAGRLARHPQLQNVQAIHANAISWVAHFVPERSLEKIFLLYPNPNPQNPAQRWFRMPFFTFLLSRLKEGGELTLATNVEAYKEEAKHFADRLDLRDETLLAPNSVPRTHFEKKYLRRGDSCWNLRFRLVVPPKR